MFMRILNRALLFICYNNYKLIAFLPSSFAMWMTFLAFSYALRPPNQISSRRTFRTVLCLGLGALLGWPFSAVVGIPFVVDEIMVYGHDGAVDRQGRVVQVIRPANWRIQRTIRLVKTIATCFIGISVPIILVDYFFYRQLMFVPLNIVLYNVFGGENQGPDIFGIEPWYYYIVNGFLNFNIMFLLALASAPFAVSLLFLFIYLRLMELRALYYHYTINDNKGINLLIFNITFIILLL